MEKKKPETLVLEAAPGVGVSLPPALPARRGQFPAGAAGGAGGTEPPRPRGTNTSVASDTPNSFNVFTVFSVFDTLNIVSGFFKIISNTFNILNLLIFSTFALLIFSTKL